jgi:hypothetical protein
MRMRIRIHIGVSWSLFFDCLTIFQRLASWFYKESDWRAYFVDLSCVLVLELLQDHLKNKKISLN